MTRGLSPNDLVDVKASIAPAAVPLRGFGIPLYIDDTPGVIDVSERIRIYSDIDEVLADWPSDSGAYDAALKFFSQEPQPSQCYLGFWARQDVAGVLHGALLTPTQQALANFTAVTAGKLKIQIDAGAVFETTGLNFSAEVNINGVAANLQTALRVHWAGATVKWNASLGRFDIFSGTAGAASVVNFAQAASAGGVDIAPLLGLRQADGGKSVPGIVAESALAAVQAMSALSNDWYCATFVSATQPNTAALTAVAQYIEASAPARIHGYTTMEQTALDPQNSSDLGLVMKGLNLARTFGQYSSTSIRAICSLFARQASVDFSAQNTTIDLMWKTQPGIVAEYISETQKKALDDKNLSVFANFSNGKAIILGAKMANGDYIDERVGVDWLVNFIQVSLWNALYQSPTKIPQTDEGTQVLVTVAKDCCRQAVNNGLLAPGKWTGPNLGQYKTGDILPLGFYVYADLVANQSEADRAARKAVPIQIACKFAGAIRTVSVLMTFVR